MEKITTHEQLDEIFMGNTTYDPTGATISVLPHKTNERKLYLQLGGEKKQRLLGTVDIKNRLFKVSRSEKRHTFRKNDSFGFNHHVLSQAKLFDHLLIAWAGKKYKVPREVILEKGSFLHFKTEGFERQIFLEKSEIAKYQQSKERKQKKPSKKQKGENE